MITSPALVYGPYTTGILTFNEATNCWERFTISNDMLDRTDVHPDNLRDAAERFARDTDAEPGTLWRCDVWDDADEHLLITGPTFEMP